MCMVDAGVKADVTTYSSMLDAMSKTKTIRANDVKRKVSWLLGEMKANNDVSMDVISYSALINVYGKADMYEECERVYVGMVDAGVKAIDITKIMQLSFMNKRGKK